MKILALLFALLLTGCIQRQEGPAERLGRDLDNLSDTISDIAKEDDEQRAKRLHEQELERNRRYYRSNHDSDYNDRDTGSDYYRR